MISHSPVSSVLVRVNIVAARLTNICNKTMCALLSSARLGDALPRLQLWTVAGLELGGNVTRARVTPTLRRSGYTLSREERAGHSRERGETRRRAGEQSGYNTHPCWPTRPPALTKTSFTNFECGKMFMMLVLCKNFSMMKWRLINRQRWLTIYLMTANGAASEL